MPRFSIQNISLYGFYAILASGLISGVLIFIFLNKVGNLNTEYHFYDRVHTQLSNFTYSTEKLLTAHSIVKEKLVWWNVKEGFVDCITKTRAKHGGGDDPTWRLWKTIDSESSEIKRTLEGELFSEELTMEKSILRRLGEELRSNQSSDYYTALSSLKSSIDFLLQYQGFLLDEVQDLKKYQQDRIFIQIEKTKRTGIISVVTVMVLGFVFSGFMAGIISKMEKDLVKTKTNLQERLSKEKITVDKYVAISATDEEGIITEVSTAFCLLSGFKASELIGKKHNIVASSETKTEIYKDLWESISTMGSWRGELKNRDKAGNEYWVDLIINAIRDNDGNITGYYSYSKNITNIRELRNLSITDSLTSLYNRRFFNEIFPKLIAGAKRNNSCLALVMMDIDFFKNYNDTYGHQAGDATLTRVAGVIRSSLTRVDDYSFRIGGEEFAMIYDLKDEDNAVVVADRAIKAVEKLAIKHSTNPVSKYVTISSGVYVVHPNDSSTVDAIYRKCDQALYRAKKTGRNKVVLS